MLTRRPSLLSSPWLLAAAAVAMTGCALAPADGPDGPGPAPWLGGKADVFGVDDRAESSAYAEDSPVRDATRAVAAMVRRDRLVFGPDAVSLAEPPDTLQSTLDLCDDERFAAQPVIAGCSGFLVAPDILVTAGHCLDLGYRTAYEACANSAWIFGYEYDDEAAAESGAIPAIAPDDVYGCAEILAVSNEECRADFAVVRLEREVTDRTPLTIESSRPSLGDSVSAIGFPRGVPMKVAPGRIADMSYYTSGHSFEATVDGFRGNSGGPLIDVDGYVRGILVCGNVLPEYVPSEDGCWRSTRCEDDGTCSGMGIYAMDNLAPFLDCHVSGMSPADCIPLLPSYPECDPYAPDCAPDRACSYASRVDGFRCLPSTENLAEVGEPCHINACRSDAVCVRPPGMGSRATDARCQTLCESSDDCGRDEECGPVEWRYGQARVCYPR